MGSFSTHRGIALRILELLAEGRRVKGRRVEVYSTHYKSMAVHRGKTRAVKEGGGASLPGGSDHCTKPSSFSAA